MRRSARRDSERLDHHQDHDQRHGDTRNFVKQPQLLARKSSFAALELARGERRLTGKQLRLLNEVPGVAVALIVILVVIKPF